MAPPITVHRPRGESGRRVTFRSSGGVDQILGIAHSDTDLRELLRRAGLPDSEELLDDPTWVEWRGTRPHGWEDGRAAGAG